MFFLHPKKFLKILLWIVYYFLCTVVEFSQILFLPLQDHLWLFMICTWFGDAFRDSLAHIKLRLKIIINLNLDENSSQMWWKSKDKCQDCMRNIFYIHLTKLHILVLAVVLGSHWCLMEFFNNLEILQHLHQ